MDIQKINLSEKLAGQSQGFQRVFLFDFAQTGYRVSLEYVVLPTGAESIPHMHVDAYTVVFTLQGGVSIYHGRCLEYRTRVQRHDSVFIPPNVIHHVVNEEEQDMIAIVARAASANIVKEFPNLLNLPEHHVQELRFA